MNRVQRSIESDPHFEKDSWVRFTGFKDSGLEMEVWAYLTSNDYAEFQLIQQKMLLDMMGIIEEEGAFLSVPSRITYLVDTPGTPRKDQAQNK